MKAKRSILALFACGMALTGCGIVPGTNITTIEPGYVGLKVDLYGKNKGIENAEIVSGRVWYNGYAEKVYKFPAFRVTYPFTQNPTEGSPNDESIVFSVAGTSVNADVGLSVSWSTEALPETSTYPTKIHAYFARFRKDPETFIDTDGRAILRTCFNLTAEQTGLTPVDLATNRGNLLAGVTNCIRDKIPEVVVEEISLLSNFNLPQDIQERINRRAAAQQAAEAAQFEKQKAEAEADTRVAEARGKAQALVEEAKGEAEANRILSQSIDDKVLRLKELDIRLEQARKWDGRRAPTIQTPNIQLGAPAAGAAPQ